MFPESKQGGDSCFGCQASSMAFLAENGFDFNKCIRKGIPYVPAANMARVEAQRQRTASRPPIVVSGLSTSLTLTFQMSSTDPRLSRTEPFNSHTLTFQLSHANPPYSQREPNPEGQQ